METIETIEAKRQRKAWYFMWDTKQCSQNSTNRY